jgi:hypothetical protein
MGILDYMPNTKALIEAAKNQPSLEERIEALEQVMLEQILAEEVEEDV